jgi:hypothetical protein
MFRERLIARASRTAALVVLVCLAAAATVTAKPDRVPVALEFVPPRPDMKRGDVVETVIGFRALADLQQLEISVYVDYGVEIVSAPAVLTFTDVKAGDAPQVKVSVRLTADEFGSLVVSYRTRTAKETAAAVKTIVYGKRDH